MKKSMKTVFKLLFLALLVPMVIHSCRDEDFTIDDKEPSFELYNTTLASNVLYPTMESNTFRLAWDNSLGGAEYTVEVSSSEDFASSVVLGTSSSTSYTTTIGALNEAAIAAGLKPYLSEKLYFRVVSGSNVSNIISTDLTTYPTAKPIITSPSAGAQIVLDGGSPNSVASTFTWSDYEYGTQVNYLVEIAKSGTENYVTAGAVVDARQIALLNSELNDATFRLGLPAGVSSDVDIRVTANTSSVGGSLSAVSTPVTISITPYLAFKNLFLVGEATMAGWSTNNGNSALYRDANELNKFYYTGYFLAGGFKVLEKLGDNTWNPQWGLKDGVVSVSNPDGSGEPAVFVIPSAGYYTFELDILEKTYSITAYTGDTSVVQPQIGIVGDATPLGWDAQTNMTKSDFDAHHYSLRNVTLKVGEFKFRVDDSWAVNWGTNVAFSGQATPGGPNIPVTQAGVYDIFFNDLDGRYVLVKKD